MPESWSSDCTFPTPPEQGSSSLTWPKAHPASVPWGPVGSLLHPSVQSPQALEGHRFPHTHILISSHPAPYSIRHVYDMCACMYIHIYEGIHSLRASSPPNIHPQMLALPSASHFGAPFQRGLSNHSCQCHYPEPSSLCHSFLSSLHTEHSQN